MKIGVLTIFFINTQRSTKNNRKYFEKCEILRITLNMSVQ